MYIYLMFSTLKEYCNRLYTEVLLECIPLLSPTQENLVPVAHDQTKI